MNILRNKNLATGASVLLIVAAGVFGLGAGVCRAAVLNFETENAQVAAGDIIAVDLKVDNQEECLNVVQAGVRVTGGAKIIGTSQDGSILSLWPQAPIVNASGTELNLTGGVPGGYCGRVPGDQGASNAIVRIFLKILGGETGSGIAGVAGGAGSAGAGAGASMTAVGQGAVAPTSARLEFVENKNVVLLNDGLGTAAALKLEALELKIGAPAETPTNAWSSELAADTTPPEAFTIEPTRDKNVFDGRYYIYFSTNDKQTGIAYYEVQEGAGVWKQASSPYLLQDQKLKSVIRVRAVDWAGNQSMAEYRPRLLAPVWKPSSFFLWAGGVILLLLVAVNAWFLVRHFKNKKYGKA